MSDPCKILVLNGPNLGHLGERQPEIYGREGMGALPELLRRIAPAKASSITLIFDQHNHEGGLIDRLELARTDGTRGVVLNAGAYTHTSLALADCLAWIGLPTVEVHLSNILAREEERRKSLIARHCLGVISGFGLQSYALAVLALHERLAGETA